MLVIAGFVLTEGCIVRGIEMGSKELFLDLVRFVAAKDIQPPVEKVFGFSYDEVIAAFDYRGSGTHVGKFCIDLEK